MADPVATSPAPRVTPTASQPVRIPWGAWLAQAAAHEEHIVEAAAEAGLKLALAQVPFGSIIGSFIGPQLIDQYVEMGVKALGGLIGGATVDIPAGTIFATVGNLINANEPAFASFIGDRLDPMIAAALAKIGIKV
jgi:hypothetical protein